MGSQRDMTKQLTLIPLLCGHKPHLSMLCSKLNPVLCYLFSLLQMFMNKMFLTSSYWMAAFFFFLTVGEIILYNTVMVHI